MNKKLGALGMGFVRGFFYCLAVCFLFVEVALVTPADAGSRRGSSASSVTSHANEMTLEQAFERLADQGIDFSTYGTICEEVTRLLIQDEAGPQYQVETGVQYGTRLRIYGDMDVVKLRRVKGGLVLDTVYEVKCRSNFEDAYRTLEVQRDHFYQAMREGVRANLNQKGSADSMILLTSTAAPTIHFSFAEWIHSVHDIAEIAYVAVSQAGGEDFGFTTLPFTRDELTGLRADLMACQTTGPCLKPL